MIRFLTSMGVVTIVVLELCLAGTSIQAQTETQDLQQKFPFDQADFSFPLPPPDKLDEGLPTMEQFRQSVLDRYRPAWVANMGPLVDWLTSKNPKIDLSQLELVEPQREEIRELADQWQQTREELQQKIDAATSAREKGELQWELQKEEQAFRKALVDVLVPEQLRQLENCDAMRMGLTRVLTDSLVGADLKLTDQQKQRIRKRSHELAMEIESFIDKTRHEYYDLIMEELSDEQRARLVEFYGLENLKKLFAARRIDALHRDLIDPDQLDASSTERHVPTLSMQRLLRPTNIDFKALEQTEKVNR